MGRRFKKASLAMLFAISLSTVGSITSTYTNTVSASKHKAKHKKSISKKSSKYQRMAQLTKDVSNYNNVVSYFSDPINNSSSLDYTLTSPNYSKTYSGMSDSLHAMAHDMSLNNADPHDAYEGNMGNIFSPDTSLSMLSDSVSQLYGMFSSRLKSKMSSSDFTNLFNTRDNIVKGQNQIESYLSQNNYSIPQSSDLITNQWKMIQEFYNTLGNNINKLQ